jgi:hypothetical protein
MPAEYLVISYVPLLRALPGEVHDPASIELESLLQTDAGHVHAIVWARNEADAFWPVFVLDRAREIVEHLLDWSVTAGPAGSHFQRDRRGPGTHPARTGVPAGGGRFLAGRRRDRVATMPRR